VGYVAVMEWSRVQDERPRASTSGGQFSGCDREEVAPAGGVVVETFEGDVVCCFVIAAHDAKEVQERHLAMVCQ